MTRLTLSRALNEGLRKSLEDNPKALIMGEDVGRLGGVFRVTDGLQKDFGEARVMDTPLAESGIIGTAIGLALRGYRPICEIQFDGFVYPAFDQIVTQLAKMRYRSLGSVRLPLVIRIPFGGGIRRCLGASFALMEMKVVLSTILKSVTLRSEASGSGGGESTMRRAVTFAPSRGGRIAVARA